MFKLTVIGGADAHDSRGDSGGLAESPAYDAWELGMIFVITRQE